SSQRRRDQAASGNSQQDLVQCDQELLCVPENRPHAAHRRRQGYALDAAPQCRRNFLRKTHRVTARGWCDDWWLQCSRTVKQTFGTGVFGQFWRRRGGRDKPGGRRIPSQPICAPGAAVCMPRDKGTVGSATAPVILAGRRRQLTF
ncbi:unnamed protein product, partial [Phaeothamnion confervicola]